LCGAECPDAAPGAAQEVSGPVVQRPEAAMLLHHLGADHLAEAKPYLACMEVECIDAVVMELFERVRTP
jgi:hypothetical protein